MKVILLERMRKLGDVGELVQVKNGYGRNFLIPNKKALRATKDNIEYFEVKKKEIQAANAEKVKEAEAISKKINDLKVAVIQQASEDGRLYGSVNISSIAKAISGAAGEKISPKLVVLHNPIKYIGVHTIEVDLHADVIANVHINIARSKSEAEEQLARFNKGETVMEGPGANVNDDEEVAEEILAAVEAEEEKAETTDEADTESKEEAA